MSSRIALGTVQFGLSYGVNNRFGQVGENEVRRILQRARKGEIDTLDTAAAYGDSERVLGECVGVHESHFRIVSKYPPRSELRPIKAAAASLAALRLNSLYAYLFHDAKDYFSDDGRKWDEFLELKYTGIVNHIGFSLYSPHDAEALLERGIAFDMLQIPLSLLDRRFERLLPEMRRRGIEIHARSVFLQGLVFRKPETLPEFFAPVIPSLRHLAMHSADTGLSIEALCLGFALSHEMVDRVVVGVECVQDLEDDLCNAHKAESAGIRWSALSDIECTDENILLPFNWKT
jgi:aryl-alcohol dehydrogenase-like predicted oxidoreductase